jgi:hypothetical protein
LTAIIGLSDMMRLLLKDAPIIRRLIMRAQERPAGHVAFTAQIAGGRATEGVFLAGADGLRVIAIAGEMLRVCLAVSSSNSTRRR